MLDREIEHDAASYRAADHGRPVQLQGAAEGADGFGVACGGELIFCPIPAGRRIGLAVKRHVEGNDAEILRILLVREQIPPLPCVGARGVQADQRNAGAVFLEIDAMRFAFYFDMDVTADYRIDGAVHDVTATNC